jgi:hypothetical protein
MLDATKALTVIAEIDPTWRAVLDARLATIEADLDSNAVFRPKDLPHTHFMRFVIIEDHALPPLLAWESNHDREASVYLAEAVRAAPALDKVFECCRGYPAAAFRDDKARVTWLLEHAVRAAAFYTGYRGVPRDQVVNDRKLHDALRDEIDRPGGREALAGLHGCEIQRRLREQVRATHPELDTSAQGDEEWRWLLGKVLALVVLAVLLVPLLLIAIPSYFVLRAKEESDPYDENTRPVHDDKDLSAFEDRVTQNQLTHIVDIKPGAFRLGLLTAALTAIDVIARVYSVRGNLGGIISIHFARWVIIKDRWSQGPKRHRLLFFSNYDGSWESYLGEFVDRAAYGLTGVWSNTVGFPYSRHLLGAGARDEEAFKQWTRRHQIATQVWWSGVRDSTVQNIRDDIWIRRNLDRGFADDEVNRWLRKL